MSDKREALPIHPMPATTSRTVRVTGLVENPMSLETSDLTRFPHINLVDDFSCVEGWSVPALDWRGPTLAGVVRLARPRPEASYVTVAAADFATSIPLPDVLDGAGLLALYLGGEPLPQNHGGPCRLILPGQSCFTSIKWVDRIELTGVPVNTSERIALARLGQ